MAAIWGVVSGKFVIAATGLIVASRIDQGRLHAVIDIRVPRSAVSRDFAERRHLVSSAGALETQTRRPMTIGIGAEEFDQAKLAVSQSPLPAGTDLLIGRDILAEHVLAFNMQQHEVALLMKGDQARLSHRFDPISVSSGDPCALKIRIIFSGQPQDVCIDLAQQEPLIVNTGFWRSTPPPSLASPADISVGSIKLSLPVSESSSPAAAPISLGLTAFNGRVVLLDLAHGKLWIGSDRRR